MIHQSTLHYRNRKNKNQTISCPYTDENGVPCNFKTPYGKACLMQHIHCHHLKERRFKCEHCEKAYFQKWNLDKHKHNVHGIPLPTTKATRNAEYTSLPDRFKKKWILQTTNKIPKRGKAIGRYEQYIQFEGEWDNKPDHIPDTLKMYLSVDYKSGYIHYGWCIQEIRTEKNILMSERYSKEKITKIVNFMNKINVLFVLYLKDTDTLVNKTKMLSKDYKKSIESLKLAIQKYNQHAF